MEWDSKTWMPLIATVMSLTCFEKLKCFLHINDNTKMPPGNSEDFDPLYKVRPLLDTTLHCCRNVPQKENQSIDKEIIPTKGRSSLRQYLPMKPTNGE